MYIMYTMNMMRRCVNICVFRTLSRQLILDDVNQYVISMFYIINNIDQ